MDAGAWKQLQGEVGELRGRVERLEQELQQLRRSSRGKGAEPITAGAAFVSDEPAAPLLSFVPPEKPSLESRIGSQLFNRVGIVALLVGMAWFLKYAIDQQWLGPGSAGCCWHRGRYSAAGMVRAVPAAAVSSVFVLA